MPESIPPFSSDPTLRWMLFVDGENFTIRAQAVAQELKRHFSAWALLDA